MPIVGEEIIHAVSKYHLVDYLLIKKGIIMKQSGGHHLNQVTH